MAGRLAARRGRNAEKGLTLAAAASRRPDPGPPDLESAGLRLEVGRPADGAVTVTLSRPERRNAMTPRMWRGLADIARWRPPEVRVVVLRGAGPSFCSGADLRLFTGEPIPGEDPLPSASDPGFADAIASWQQGFTWLRDPRIVSVAVVQGHAIGAGFQLALACDLRLLAEDARLSMRETTLGLVPDLTGTKPLVELAGPARALDMCLTGRVVGAVEARQSRLADLVAPADELDAAVGDLVAALLAADPAAAEATKRLLRQAPANTLEQQAAAERQAQAALQRERLSRG